MRNSTTQTSRRLFNMATGGILLLTCLVFIPDAVNARRLALACENDLAKITCEQKYSRIIKISDVKGTEKSEDYCENDKTVDKTRLCVASKRDKQKLFSELGEICNNKPSCSIHLAHGPYDVIHLPCRHLNLSIRIEIIYDCIYKAPLPSIKEAQLPTRLARTEASSASLQNLPTSRLTSTTLGTPTILSRTTYTGGDATRVSPMDPKVWKRVRPKPCNITEHHNTFESSTAGFYRTVPLEIISFWWLSISVEFAIIP